MRHRTRRWTGWVAALAATCAAPAFADTDGWRTTADAGEAGLVALALGKTTAEGDWQGARQLGLSLGVTAVATAGLKSAVHETRPNGEDRKSFPSGHTSTAFAAAGYLQKRYGWEWGLPATLAAGLVGLARVESKDHHWYDVVAGAALGEATAYVFTRPRDASVRFLPWADLHGAGVVVSSTF